MALSTEDQQRKTLTDLLGAISDAPDAIRLPMEFTIAELVSQMDNPIFAFIEDPKLAIQYAKSKLDLLKTLIDTINKHQAMELSRAKEARALLRDQMVAMREMIGRIKEAKILVQINRGTDTPDSVMRKLEVHEAQMESAVRRSVR